MNEILKALSLTAEICGTQLSETALVAMEKHLSRYPVDHVLGALGQCQQTVSGRLTLAAILDRVWTNDGRPGPDEAWAISRGAHDENETVVWTSEAAVAYWAAAPLLESGDETGARMAFKQAYEREVSGARSVGVPIKWEVSQGWDKDRRAAAIGEAVQMGRLPYSAGLALLPWLGEDEAVAALGKPREVPLLGS